MNATKFSNQPLPRSLPYKYPNIWAIEQTSGPDRLIIAPASGQIDLMIELADILPGPFGILYLLLVSRCDNKPGRYQSPYPCEKDEMKSFLWHFKDYFENDGRHHIWVTSLPTSSTLVYDNHNVIYAYGPLDEYKKILFRNGLKEGTVRFPVPHTHNYNPEFDEQENQILKYWDWQRYDLMEGDDPAT